MQHGLCTPAIDRAIEVLTSALRDRNWRLATAESCTGGLVAACCTAVSGSSAWFAGAVVAYDNSIKEQVLRVAPSVLQVHGAVSGPCVEQMALGVRALLHTEVAVAISGVAGPTGATPGKPVGTVWIAWSVGQDLIAKRFLFPGDRAAVRLAAAETALAGLVERLAPQTG